MSISTNYDYSRYAQYSNAVSSLLGQQRINNKQNSQDGNSSKTLQLVDHLAQGTSQNKFKSPLASLVESGTITSEQEKAIKNALEASRMANQTQAGAANASQNPLDSLVESGIIAEEQEAAVKSAFDSVKAAHRMPPSPQLRSQMDKDSDPITGALNSLVTAGTITEEQEASIQNAFEEDMKTHMMPPPPPPHNNGIESMASILDELVENGKITSEQQETIVSALQAAFESDQAENNTVSDSLDSLVESGTITKEQEVSVQSAFKSAIEAYHAQSYSYDDMFQDSFDTSM